MIEKISTENDILEIQQDLEKAFFFFGYSYKTEPSVATAHNFGTFISKYGSECSYVKNGVNKACELLKEAINIQPNFYSLKELGDLYYNSKKYKTAVIQYQKALEFKERPDVFVNLANCYFTIGNYKKTVLVLEQATSKFNLLDEFELYVHMLKGFSYAYLGEVEKMKAVFWILAKKVDDEPSPEILQLAFFCHEYKYIIDNYKKVLETWHFDPTTFQVIYQAYLCEKKEELAVFISFFSNLVGTFYRDNNNFDQEEKDAMIKIISHGPYIPCIKFIPQFWWQIDII